MVVLAATSRPDLLDAALLRPGRLDRLLRCSMPSARERIQIVRALALRQPLAPGAAAALDAAAREAEGFTGADLGALLADAQLAAVHAALERSPQARCCFLRLPTCCFKRVGHAGLLPVRLGCLLRAMHFDCHTASHVAQDEAAAPRIMAEHVAAAAASSRPSITASERQRLEAVYARFQQGRDPGLSGSAAAKGKRATLA